MISLLEIAQSINEVDDDKIIKYKDKDGESQEMTAGAAKKQPDDHPAKVAYNQMADKGGDDNEKDAGGKIGGSDFDRDANRAADDEADDMDRDARFDADAEDDNDESDDVEISDANSGPIDRDDIMDMLKNDSEIMDKIGTGDDDDLYWDGLDLVSSKMDDQTVASIDPDSNMTLGDLKQQIRDFEYEEEDDPEKVSQFYGDDGEDPNEPTHAEIMQYIEDEGYGGDAIGPDGNPTPEAYEDAKQELMYQKQNETITINGQKYKAIKEDTLNENPAAIAAAQRAVIQAKAGKKVSVNTARQSSYAKKDPAAHKKAKSMWQRIKDRFSKKESMKESKEKPNPRVLKENYDRIFRSRK